MDQPVLETGHWIHKILIKLVHEKGKNILKM
jgi:hypothetical protein